MACYIPERQSDGKMDGCFVDEEDLIFHSDTEEEDQKGGRKDENESFAIESLSISDGNNDSEIVVTTPISTRLRENQKLPTPVTKPRPQEALEQSADEPKDDFTSSLSESYVQSALAFRCCGW